MHEPNRDVIQGLRRNQANAMVMYQNYKKYHWFSYGPLFRDVHLLLDEHAEQVLEQVDEFAERAIILGGEGIGDPAGYLKESTIVASQGKMTLRAMIEEAVACHESIIAQMHDDANTAAAADDIGTADLYTRLVQVHQKQHWFLREILRKGDGLSS